MPTGVQTENGSEESVLAKRVVLAAEEVYGDAQRASEWLPRANPRLEGRTPISLSATDTGGRKVEELLIQIDEGMYL